MTNITAWKLWKKSLEFNSNWIKGEQKFFSCVSHVSGTFVGEGRIMNLYARLFIFIVIAHSTDYIYTHTYKYNLSLRLRALSNFSSLWHNNHNFFSLLCVRNMVLLPLMTLKVSKLFHFGSILLSDRMNKWMNEASSRRNYVNENAEYKSI